ncbi:MAG TPA: ATP-binding protein [Thermoanaerobaculia bacterium]|nr:ATP-binding protein [Thermoanaerobaculia bacterium]
MPPDATPSGPSRSLAAELGFAAAVVTAAVLACFPLQRFLPVASLALVFVCAVLAVAVRSRKSVALAAALLSSLGYNFFFTEPRLTLRVTNPAEIAAVATLLIAALLVGQLAGRLREQLVLLRTANELARVARVESETERLRSALLSSVSHDLRSPLASVIGAASSLAEYGERLSPADRRQLADSIRSEGERLDRYIQNLLDMTRLGSGPLELRRDWVAFEEILSAARERLAKLAPAVEVVGEIEPGLPPLHVHAALVEQALFNVLENAAKFSPAGSPVLVRARREGPMIVIDVVDRGPGIPAEERKRIFDLFYSAARGDRRPQGTGLGLTIVRGMIGAHGGRVEALPGEDDLGTTIRIRLPLVEPPAPPAEEEP